MSRLSAAGAVLTVVTLAACSSGSRTATDTGSTATAPAAPQVVATTAAAHPAAALPVLEKTEATEQVSYGYDAEGDGNADGQFPSGTGQGDDHPPPVTR